MHPRTRTSAAPKIISGGQTGADRAALDVAAEQGLACGGWVPRGRRAEDGRVPDRYCGLVETESDAYAVRTERNVRDACASVIFCYGAPAGGTALTIEMARSLGKPLLILDLDRVKRGEAALRLRRFLEAQQPQVLNVAGPRISEEPRIHAATCEVLRTALRRSTADPTGRQSG